MSRVIRAVMTGEQRADLLDGLKGVNGIAGISVLPGASLSPPGDIVTVQVSNDAARAVLARLGEAGVLCHGSVTLSEPTALIAPADREAIDRESNEAAWEEIAAQLRRDTNVGPNFLVLMAAAGATAAIGIVEGTVHIVVGAMLLAPGFEPILRIAFGALTGGPGTGPVSGLRSMIAGYAVLAAGAAAAALLLKALGRVPDGGLSDLPLVGYWTQVGAPGVIVAVIASVAGVAILASRRTVFAAGVMVALALVPGITIAGMGLVLGEPGIAARGLLRWAADAACVAGAGGITLALKRRSAHRRRVED
ncbi:DUF389 domain-containing protein [Azospirillum halopraeferens]|uniref:DUF389 domain-containing protein n=1 Tax=Azospirillum halopraeferens TaxID=34010 RepID=UPI000410AB63|nr:DUF389 domain-containing protein [Azospirillum halopraeferens]